APRQGPQAIDHDQHPPPLPSGQPARSLRPTARQVLAESTADLRGRDVAHHCPAGLAHNAIQNVSPRRQVQLLTQERTHIKRHGRTQNVVTSYNTSTIAPFRQPTERYLI